MNARTTRHLAYVAAAFDVEQADVLGRRRTGPVANARHVLCWMLRRDGLSYPHIGRIVDRDHTTVIWGVRHVERDPRLRRIAGCA